MQQELLGDIRDLDPLLPISNRTVKRVIADDSVVRPCESRTLPSALHQMPRLVWAFVFQRQIHTNQLNPSYLPPKVRELLLNDQFGVYYPDYFIKV